jgi:hypothetical protein
MVRVDLHQLELKHELQNSQKMLKEKPLSRDIKQMFTDKQFIKKG